MYMLYGIFSEKKWLYVRGNLFTEVVSDILYGIFTYTLGDKVSRVHKKVFVWYYNTYCMVFFPFLWY